MGVKYKKGETIVNFCGRYENLLGRLLSTGYNVEESTKIWAFKNSLPQAMRETVSNWQLARPSNKVTDLMSVMKERYCETGESEETIALYSRMRIPRKSDNKSDNKQSNKLECTYCKKAGHIWKDCFKLKEDNKRKKKFANKEKKRPSEESYIANF